MAKEQLYETINKFRQTLYEMENAEDSQEAVPYTNQDEMLGQYMDSARQTFGADFNNTENPLLYIPKGENVIFRGEIAKDLDNAKFEMHLNGENAGCYIYTDSLKLTEEVVKQLNVIWGFYENWKKEIASMGDKAPMSVKGNDSEPTNNGENKSMVPGDDFGSKQQ